MSKTIADIKNEIEDINALGIKNLADKGVGFAGFSPTTYEIMQGIADIIRDSGGGIQYKSIAYNDDNTITLIETNGTEHTMACVYEDDKLVSVSYDNKEVSVNYKDDKMYIGDTVVDLSNVEDSGALLDYTVTFTVDGEPYEIVSVKSGNSVNAPATEPINNGLLLASWKMGENEVSFPFTPTENCKISGEFNLYQVVRRLTTNDIVYSRGFAHDSEYKNEYPPYTLSASNRAGYFSVDIPIEYGYTYKFEFVSTSVNSQCAICFLTQNSLDKRASGNSFGGTYYDTGWQTSGFEYEVPETYNGSPIRTVVLSFRMSPNNENVVNGFIQSVIISRKIANGGVLNE